MSLRKNARCRWELEKKWVKEDHDESFEEFAKKRKDGLDHC
jgi:hypothetical protein